MTDKAAAVVQSPAAPADPPGLPPTLNPFGTPVMAAPATAATAALAQREVAHVLAQIYAARQFPRDQAACMERILTTCGRETLAAEAMYTYVRGGTEIEGPSIRLLEAVAQQWEHIDSGTVELERRAGQSEMMAYAIDLQSNVRDTKRWIVKHWRDTQSGGYALRDERDIYEATANQAARRKRACLLAVIPSDVVDAAVQQCKETLRTKVQITPARIASLAKKFADEFAVTHGMLEKRLQRKLDSMTPAQMVQLSRVYTSLKDGMSVASDWFDVADAPDVAPTAPAKGVSGAKAALKAKAAAKSPKAATEAPTEAPAGEPERPIADADAVPPADKDPPF
jgi:hypothetical protein